MPLWNRAVLDTIEVDDVEIAMRPGILFGVITKVSWRNLFNLPATVIWGERPKVMA